MTDKAADKKDDRTIMNEEKEKRTKKEEKLLEDELSEEDKQLRDKLELCIERLSDSDAGLKDKALQEIKTEVSGATSSLTSVPKPLKFLNDHYEKIKEIHKNQPSSQFKSQLSDLLSVLGMVAANEESYECLDYCLSGTQRNLKSWGHEYLRSLSGQIGQAYLKRVEESKPFDDLMKLVDVIVPEFINHNEEPEAVDLLMEVEQLPQLNKFTNESNFERVCNYLQSCAQYAADPEEMKNAYKTAYEIFISQKQYALAMRVAQKVNNTEMISQAMEKCEDRSTKKQLAYMLGRQRNPFETEDEELFSIISNEKLSENFKSLARDLDVLEPKHPDQIFKTHLEERKYQSTQHIDSAKQNLAATYVNAFVNCGFGKDKLMTDQEETQKEGEENSREEKWIFKVKEEGQIAAGASLGMILLWDIDEALTQIDKYMDHPNIQIQAGSFMAIGIVNSGIKNECDPVGAILRDKLESVLKQDGKIGALMGLSFAYAGSAREDLLESISPIILDNSNTMELQAIAALSIGMIYVGTCDEDAAQCILQTLMEKTDEELNHPFTRIFALGLGLLFLGQQDLSDATHEACGILQSEKYAEFVQLVVETCAYAGSGNVLKVQRMLHLCAEHKKEEEEDIIQVAAVLGVAMIAFGEDIGTEMCMRTMNHLLQYGEPVIKRNVPLAIGLLRISNPEVASLDLLTKLSYDSDETVAMSSIFGLGLIGAGTNNSRISGNLRYLAQYYAKQPEVLFVVRIAQGLVHMGKGLMGLNPLHSDKFLFSNVSLGGLLAVLFASTEMKHFIAGKYHYFLYYLVLSIYPRMLITLDENGEQLKTSVRVGQAVDTVGQAGRKKTITGFQTHDTPVLIGHGERAELASEEFLPTSQIMENFVILKPNPDYEAEKK